MTMSWAAWFTISVVVLGVGVLIWEVLALDLIFLGMLAVLIVSGILSPEEVLVGFSNQTAGLRRGDGEYPVCLAVPSGLIARSFLVMTNSLNLIPGCDQKDIFAGTIVTLSEAKGLGLI